MASTGMGGTVARGTPPEQRGGEAGRIPSTLLGATVPGYPDQLVEVEAVAVLPPAAGDDGSTVGS